LGRNPDNSLKTTMSSVNRFTLLRASKTRIITPARVRTGVVVDISGLIKTIDLDEFE
jgi:hypothetical protein